jgi:hypothetical protein
LITKGNDLAALSKFLIASSRTPVLRVFFANLYEDKWTFKTITNYASSLIWHIAFLYYLGHDLLQKADLADKPNAKFRMSIRAIITEATVCIHVASFVEYDVFFFSFLFFFSAA